MINATNEGLKQGIEQGYKQGMEQGIKKGMEQANKNIYCEIVKNMLKKNIDISTISNVTGLSEKEIEKLI